MGSQKFREIIGLATIAFSPSRSTDQLPYAHTYAEARARDNSGMIGKGLVGHCSPKGAWSRGALVTFYRSGIGTGRRHQIRSHLAHVGHPTETRRKPTGSEDLFFFLGGGGYFTHAWTMVKPTCRSLLRNLDFGKGLFVRGFMFIFRKLLVSCSLLFMAARDFHGACLC